MTHSELSPSGAHRWMICPGSVTRSRGVEDVGSTYADEGTRAHMVADYVLRGKELEIENADPDMLQHAREYADWIGDLSLYDEWETERRFDLREWIPAGYGTADFYGVAGDVLTVADYKYGQGVVVSAYKNPQLMCYALGALSWVEAYYDVKTVRMMIAQPRRGNFDVCSVPAASVREWGADVLRPAAELATRPDAPVNPGEHCRFCRISGRCPEQYQYAINVARNVDFGTMFPEELAEAYGSVGTVEAWLTAIKAAAEKIARETGLPGYKWVEGRSIRKWRDEEVAADAIVAAGAEPYTKKIIGITEATRILGKAAVAALTTKPAGKPALVPEADARPAINPGDAFLGSENDEH